MKVQLKGRVIPLRADGYPNFTSLDENDARDGELKSDSVLSVFSPAEVVELVNRALYQLDYQKVAHQKYQQRQRDFQAPIKAALKELFPGVSWLKATPQQIQAAMEKAYPKSEEEQ
jgi:hypothetical protein